MRRWRDGWGDDEKDTLTRRLQELYGNGFPREGEVASAASKMSLTKKIEALDRLLEMRKLIPKMSSGAAKS